MMMLDRKYNPVTSNTQGDARWSYVKDAQWSWTMAQMTEISKLKIFLALDSYSARYKIAPPADLRVAWYFDTLRGAPKKNLFGG